MSKYQLNSVVFPEVFNRNGTMFVECEFDANSSGTDQLQSEVVFVGAVVENDNVKTTIPLVVKFEPDSLVVRNILNIDLQFYNEVLMYQEILPFLNRENIVEELFAKCYHGVGIVDEADGNKNIVVLQDLRPLGYKLAKERGHIDFEHLAIGMSKLGRFHALSYAAKKEFPKKFFDLANKLLETSWTEGSNFNETIVACIHRAVDPLIEKGSYVKVLQSLLDRIKDNGGLNRFMKDLTAPEESTAVICHGDFCRNNIFFKYNSEGKPTDVKFFDIATARYSSPAVDISFFLLLNGSRNLRHAHWDDLLFVYHQALSTAVPGLEVPSLEDIRREVRMKAIYGFVHCSFFLPMMLFDKPPQNLDFLNHSSTEEVTALHTQWGGEQGTKVLTEMVEDLIDLGCLVPHNKYIFPFSETPLSSS